MSTARFAAPAKVSGLGFRKAIAAVRLTAKPAPVAPKAVAMTVCKTKAKPGHGKAKTNKSAAKRFKITASGKVCHHEHAMFASRTHARSRRARISRRIGFRVLSSHLENLVARRRGSRPAGNPQWFRANTLEGRRSSRFASMYDRNARTTRSR
jgi:large subunit ribosomal protein L35